MMYIVLHFLLLALIFLLLTGIVFTTGMATSSMDDEAPGYEKHKNKYMRTRRRLIYIVHIIYFILSSILIILK